MTARKTQLGQEKRGRTARTRQRGQDSQNKTAGTGQRNSTAGTDNEDRTSGQERNGRTAGTTKIGPENDRWRMTTRTGEPGEDSRGITVVVGKL
jgi:hypothetical protein